MSSCSRSDWIRVSLAGLLLISCVTRHPSEPQSSYASSLQTSCTISPVIQLDQVHAVLCSFENTSQQMLQVELTAIELDDDARLMEAAELASIIEAAEQQQQDQRFDRKVGSLAVVGLGLLAVFSGDPDLMSIGGAAISGAVVHDDLADLDEAHRQQQFGAMAIYSYGEKRLKQSMTIPAGLYVRRGFLIHRSLPPETLRLCYAGSESCQSFSL